MKRKTVTAAAHFVCILTLLLLLFGGGRSERDCIRTITGQELPQAEVVMYLRGDDGHFAVFFELPAADAEELCRSLPTKDGWHPLEPDGRFGIGQEADADLTGLSGSYVRVTGNRGGKLPYLLRLEAGRTLVAVLAHICM